MATATPTNKLSSHDITLTQGANTIGLILSDSAGRRNKKAWKRSPITGTSLKMYTGPTKYSDMEPPWTPIMQNDWSGGRGSLDFDKDASAYADGWQVNTIKAGEAILGPKATKTALPDRDAKYLQTINTGVSWQGFGDSIAAHRILPALTITGPRVTLYVKKTGAPGNLLITTLADTAPDSGTPANWSDTGAGTVTAASITAGTWTSVTVVVAAWSTATTRWLAFKTSGMDASNYWEIGAGDNYMEDGAYAYYVESEGWTVVNRPPGIIPPSFLIDAAGSAAISGARFFEYKGALYMVADYPAGGAPKLYINGDRGATTSGSTYLITDTAKAWATGQWVGAIVKITAGAGSSQVQTWRLITDSDNVTLNVTPTGWSVSPGAGTEYVITATNYWTEITGHGLTAPVSDVLVVNGAVYFCQGAAANVRRMREYNSAGTWTRQFADEGYAAQWMIAGKNATIWKAVRGVPAQIASATGIDCTGSGAANALSFGTALTVGDAQERIMGLEIYGEYGDLWVLKEASIWKITQQQDYDQTAQAYVTYTTIAQVDLPEMRNTLDDRNGYAHLTHGKYLFFSWHDGLERYYESNSALDGIGPDKSEAGLASDRKGNVQAMAGYPGQIYAGIDAGNSGYASVLCYNGTGWCEMWRSANQGERLRTLHVQSIPGNAVDRLWISAGSDIYWIPLSLDPANHPNDGYNGYHYCQSGHLITSWFYLSLHGVNKFWSALRLVLEEGSATVPVTVEYQVDGSTTWTTVAGYFDEFVKELDFAATPSVTGRRLRLRVTLSTLTDTLSPKLIASVIEAAARTPMRYVTSFSVRLADDDHDALGNPDPQGAAAKIALLQTWAESALPVTMHSDNPALDGKVGFLDAVSFRPFERRREEQAAGHVGSMEIIEIA